MSLGRLQAYWTTVVIGIAFFFAIIGVFGLLVAIGCLPLR
jgi:hypothetical protein